MASLFCLHRSHISIVGEKDLRDALERKNLRITQRWLKRLDTYQKFFNDVAKMLVDYDTHCRHIVFYVNLEDCLDEDLPKNILNRVDFIASSATNPERRMQLLLIPDANFILNNGYRRNACFDWDFRTKTISATTCVSKYLIDIDICSYDTTFCKFINYSTVLFRPKRYYWYMDKLRPWSHYVPMPKDNIPQRILWALKNPETCKKIAKNASKVVDSITYENEVKRVSIAIVRICGLTRKR